MSGRRLQDREPVRGSLRYRYQVPRGVRERVQKWPLGCHDAEVRPRDGAEQGDGVRKPRVIGEQQQRTFCRHALSALDLDAQRAAQRGGRVARGALEVRDQRRGRLEAQCAGALVELVREASGRALDVMIQALERGLL